MYLKKAALLFILFVLSLSCVCVCAADYSIHEFNINNISIPYYYSSCSRERCDGSFLNTLAANGYTYDTWKNNVMIPQNMYICARDAYGNSITISIFDPSSEEDKKSDIKYHRLMYDYNLYESVNKAKEKVLVKYRNYLVENGVNKRKIKRIKWYNKGELSEETPYILGIYEKISGALVYDWYTIYDGNTISMTYTTKTELDKNKMSSLAKIIEGIELDNVIDYAEAKQVYRQNQRVKLPERLTEKQTKSKILIGMSLCFIVIVFLVAINITIAKIRKRTESGRSSRYGKY